MSEQRPGSRSQSRTSCFGGSELSSTSHYVTRMPTSLHPWSGEQIGFMPFPVNRTRDNYHLPIRVQVGPTPTAGRAAQASLCRATIPGGLFQQRLSRCCLKPPALAGLLERRSR